LSTYLLDNNCCIGVINGRLPSVRTRFRAALEAGDRLLVSAIVLFELWYGVAHSERPEQNVRRLREFLAGSLEILGFDEQDARLSGEIRAQLRSAGTPIGPYDVLLAGQALRHGATLITTNVSEFARVPGLHWEDWAR